MKQTYKDLVVWQKAVELVTAVYELTESFPSSEQFGLSNQLRRAAVSIPSNLAEGKLRGHGKEWRRFLLMAYGSAGELDTQLQIAQNLGYTHDKQRRAAELLEEVMKMLHALIERSTSAYRLTPIA